MKFSLKFIEEFLEIGLAPKDLASRLTMAGMEVERFDKVGDDWVFQIEVTTNRYDWLSMVGIAKEVAAILAKKAKIIKPLVINKPILKEKNIIIKNAEDCPYYIARVISNVKVGWPPLNVKERIINCGLSSVNNIVDVANYYMLKWGNPLHAFDYDKIDGNIYVRRAKEGEAFIGIDGKSRNLSKDNLVIADNKKTIAIAGIMGAKNTEVDERTKNVLLEAAIFSPIVIRRSRRSIGLDTESSYRFERMVSAQHLEYASYEAAKLIEKLSKGFLRGFKSVGLKPRTLRKKITINILCLNSYLGLSFSRPIVKKVLESLGFETENLSKDKLKIIPPDSRFDIKSEVDIYEEFSRIYGYDKITPQIPFLSRRSLKRHKGDLYHFKNKLRTCLSLLGFNEIITYSIEGSEELSAMGYKDDIIKVLNPLRKQEDSLRPSLLLGMLKGIKHNLNRDQSSMHFFEIANIYIKNKNGFFETPCVSMGISGQREDFFYLKAAVEKVFKYLNIAGLFFKEENNINFMNSLGIFLKNPQNIRLGFLGKLDEKAKKELSLKEEFFYANINIPDLFKNKCEKKYQSFSPYPITWRDISICLRKDIKFKEVERVIREGSSYFLDLRIIDVYKGQNLPADTSSFTLRIFYQSREKTLTSQEVDYFHNNIRDGLSKRKGITLR